MDVNAAWDNDQTNNGYTQQYDTSEKHQPINYGATETNPNNPFVSSTNPFTSNISENYVQPQLQNDHDVMQNKQWN